MDLDEISDADFYERKHHYKSQMCNDDSPIEEKIWANKYGHDVASGEMLNEIHVMLRELLKRSNP